MSVKFGKCRLCPADDAVKRLYGSGLCSYHLAHPTDDHSKKKKAGLAEAKLLVSDQVMLREFFATAWKEMPAKCENGCGARLQAITLTKAKFMICHIVPKEHFKSVMVHPLNRWFGCWQCHHDYDSSWASAATMPVWPLVLERFTSFMKLIKDTELRRLPDPMRQLVDNTFNP